MAMSKSFLLTTAKLLYL